MSNKWVTVPLVTFNHPKLGQIKQPDFSLLPDATGNYASAGHNGDEILICYESTDN